MGYFKVIAKCGHVGRNGYVLKAFYIEASSKKEAARIIRYTPRVKHNHKDAIREVIALSLDDYCQGKKVMSEDPYFSVHSRQEQALLCPDIYEFTYKEEEKTKYQKKGNFKHIKEDALLKEMKKEMDGGYLYE